MPSLSVADVRTARYFPEILPSTIIRDINPTSLATPAPLDLRRYGNRFLRLQDIFMQRDNNARYTLNGDDFSIERRAGAVDDDIMNGISISAFDNISYDLFNTSGGTINDFRTYFNLLIDDPTIARKLKYNQPLTEEEQGISDNLGIANSVDKGVLPLPYSFKFEREYQVIDSFVSSVRVGSVPTTNAANFDNFSANPDEILVVTEIASDPFTASDNFRIIIDRDDDIDYITLKMFVVNSINDSIKMFIPALRELKFKAIANTGLSNADIRLTIKKVKLTNILRVRFGLVTADEVPGDLFNKVNGGVL